MKIYIAGKITGNDDYMNEFIVAQDLIEKRGHKALNPAAVSSVLPEDLDYEDYMRIGLTMLETADAICLLHNWKDSKGANREFGYALGTNKAIYYLDLSSLHEGGVLDGKCEMRLWDNRTGKGEAGGSKLVPG